MTLKVLFLLVSLCCEGEVAVTSTRSMALSPTDAWKLPPASPVLTSVSSAGGMYLKIKDAARVRSEVSSLSFSKPGFGLAHYCLMHLVM